MRSRRMAGLLLAVTLSATARGEAPDGGGAPAAVRCAGMAAPSLRDAASNLAVVRVATRRAAKREALRRCRAAVEALPLASGGTVGEALPRDRSLSDAVEASLRAARVAGAPRYFADGGVALELEVALAPLAPRLAATPGR